MTADEIESELHSAAWNLLMDNADTSWNVWEPGDDCGYDEKIDPRETERVKKILKKKGVTV